MKNERRGDSESKILSDEDYDRTIYKCGSGMFFHTSIY